MVYICLPAAYYHLNLDVTKENLLAAGMSAVPAAFLVYIYIPVLHFLSNQGFSDLQMSKLRLVTSVTYVSSYIAV